MARYILIYCTEDPLGATGEKKQRGARIEVSQLPSKTQQAESNRGGPCTRPDRISGRKALSRRTSNCGQMNLPTQPYHSSHWVSDQISGRAMGEGCGGREAGAA